MLACVLRVLCPLSISAQTDTIATANFQFCNQEIELEQCSTCSTKLWQGAQLCIAREHLDKALASHAYWQRLQPSTGHLPNERKLHCQVEHRIEQIIVQRSAHNDRVRLAQRHDTARQVE